MPLQFQPVGGGFHDTFGRDIARTSIGAFIAGVAIAETIEDKEILEKLEIAGYSFLIPVFFIEIGLRFDFGLIIANKSNLLSQFLLRY